MLHQPINKVTSKLLFLILLKILPTLVSKEEHCCPEPNIFGYQIDLHDMCHLECSTLLNSMQFSSILMLKKIVCIYVSIFISMYTVELSKYKHGIEHVIVMWLLSLGDKIEWHGKNRRLMAYLLCGFRWSLWFVWATFRFNSWFFILILKWLRICVCIFVWANSHFWKWLVTKENRVFFEGREVVWVWT